MKKLALLALSLAFAGIASAETIRVAIDDQQKAAYQKLRIAREPLAA